MDENAVLRKLLWLNHGHQELYADDGEMQCPHCLLDFKRDPIERIQKRFGDMAFERMLERSKTQNK